MRIMVSGWRGPCRDKCKKCEDLKAKERWEPSIAPAQEKKAPLTGRDHTTSCEAGDGRVHKRS